MSFFETSSGVTYHFQTNAYLKEELAWAIDKWFLVFCKIMLFKQLAITSYQVGTKEE